jgi:hypothetical protein
VGGQERSKLCKEQGLLRKRKHTFEGGQIPLLSNPRNGSAPGKVTIEKNKSLRGCLGNVSKANQTHRFQNSSFEFGKDEVDTLWLFNIAIENRHL